jgi:hypothetical protein
MSDYGSAEHMYGHWGIVEKRERVTTKDIIKLLKEKYPQTIKTLTPNKMKNLSVLIPQAIETLDEKDKTSDNKYAGESFMIDSATMKKPSNLYRISEYIKLNTTAAEPKIVAAVASEPKIVAAVASDKKSRKRIKKRKSSRSKSSSSSKSK